MVHMMICFHYITLLTSALYLLLRPQDSFRFGQNIRQAMLDIRALFNQKEKKI